MVGEILNNCSSSYAEVAVTVVLLNSLVNLQVDTEQKSAGPLGPGEKGSFGVSWRMRGASDPQPRAREGAWDTVVIGVQGIGASQGPTLGPRLLVEINEKGSVIVTNSTGRDTNLIRIWRTGYNREGRVVASDVTTLLNAPLKPGESASNSLNPSSNPSSRLYAVNYYAAVGQPVRWSVRAAGSIGE
ncbi:MAG: hypothetical protein ACE5JL_16270 [Dehalococcoidia bacterium]